LLHLHLLLVVLWPFHHANPINSSHFGTMDDFRLAVNQKGPNMGAWREQ
jgi:hypothetical protein